MSEVVRRSNKAPRRRGVIIGVGVVLGGAMARAFPERGLPRVESIGSVYHLL